MDLNYELWIMNYEFVESVISYVFANEFNTNERFYNRSFKEYNIKLMTNNTFHKFVIHNS